MLEQRERGLGRLLLVCTSGRQGTPRSRGRPMMRTAGSVLLLMLWQAGKNLRPIDPHRLQTLRVEAKRLEQRRGNLRGLYRGREGLRRERRVRQQHSRAAVKPCYRKCEGGPAESRPSCCSSS